MQTIDPAQITGSRLHQYLLGAIAPRPIAFVSSMDEAGNPNLSPFSFFNAFGVNPSTLIFSPNRRNRDASIKHTLENVKVVPEVVINVVTYDMVYQASLASTEYPRGVNEFEKAGFGMLTSEKVRPFRVAESPVQFECKIREVRELSEQAGAPNLVICEVLLVHVNEDILNENGVPDPLKLRLVGRMGGDYYVKAFGDSLFKVPKPIQHMGIGIDKLPLRIRHSRTLTGNDLGLLGNIDNLPAQDEIDLMRKNPGYMPFLSHGDKVTDAREQEIHQKAQQMIAEGMVAEALCLLMAY